MEKLVKIPVCLIFIAVAVGGAYAQFAKPEHAIKYRKSVMFLIAQHFGRMGAVVKGKAPYDQEAFTRNALVVETLSHLPWQASLVPGTDKGDTTLNAAVFAQQSEFNAGADRWLFRERPDKKGLRSRRRNAAICIKGRRGRHQTQYFLGPTASPGSHYQSGSVAGGHRALPGGGRQKGQDRR